MRGSSNDRPIPPALYNLKDDPREGMIPGNDLIKKHPKVAQALRAEWEKWDAGNQAPAKHEWSAKRKEKKAEKRGPRPPEKVFRRQGGRPQLTDTVSTEMSPTRSVPRMARRRWSARTPKRRSSQPMFRPVRRRVHRPGRWKAG